ncbi:MAG: redox-sensing transcriptional repressor Rex, partial [Clostridia bacterium]|nr:redox-sensing transcriptional repressor Rex [Clostridia bacterium]
IHVLAAFDNSPAKVGAVGGKPVYPMDRFEELVKRHGIRVGILAVPRAVAQEACDGMVRAGIRAVLSFAPVHLHVPEGVTVKYEDLAVSLAALCGGIDRTIID